MSRIFIMSVAILASVTAICTASAQTPAAFDGTYVGSMTAISNETSTNRNCGDNFRKTLIIQNGLFSFPYNAAHNEFIKGTVAGDGTISAFGASASGGNKLTGRIQGKTFIGQVGSGGCSYALQLTKN